MNWSEYLQLSEKTLSLEFHHEEQTRNLLHAIMGILTEMDELFENKIGEEDITNIQEEVGDVCWYLAILGREIQLDYRQVIIKDKVSDPQECILKIIKICLKLLDPLKKKLYYNKSIDMTTFKTLTTLLMLNLSDYANYYEINLENCFEQNIAKLKARYGEKFSSDKAINRDLETERNILEGKS